VRDITANTDVALSQTLPASATPGEPTLRSVLAAPLVFNEQTIGVLTIYHQDPRAYTAEHRRVLDRVSQRAASVIYNALIFEEAQAASLTDSLTGLLNRRGVQQRVEEELARARRENGPLTLLLLDMDGLKHLNDTFGHHAGDRALRSVALALRSKLRPTDICARYAGDEFVVALPSCSPADAAARQHQLQSAVDALTIDLGHGHVMPLAISAGAAIYPADGTTFDGLVASADKHMYRDKTARRAGKTQPRHLATGLDLAG
jgi:diguanylate cyclase (GGDEF)-like protein